MQLLFLSWTEILIIILVILLLFGGKKIPELMRGVGQGVKSFKDGMNGIDNDTTKNETKQTSTDNHMQEQSSSTSNNTNNSRQ